LQNRYFVEFTAYAPASSLRASLMEARVTKVAREGFGGVFEVLGETALADRQVVLVPGAACGCLGPALAVRGATQ
jgi:hypothetical protein